MARRSPWAAQSKKERTRVRAEMRHLPLGKKRVFFETAFLGAAGSKREAKLQLVRQNRPATIRGAVKQSGGNRKILEETLRSPERLRPAALDAAVGALLRETLGSELKQAGEETKRHLAKYLSKRGMQVSKRDDRQALDAAMTQFMNEHVTQNGKRLFNPTEPLDLRWFEREYLRQRKNKRTIEQAFARDVNHMVRMVSEEHRLNARQQRALRQWFQKNKIAYWTEKMAFYARIISLKTSEMEPNSVKKISDLIIDHATGWALKAEQEAIRRFGNNATAATPTARPPRTSTQGYQKSGTRMQRKAAHANGTDIEETPRERTQDLQTRKDMARTTGVPFSQTRYIFGQITHQNPAAAQFLSQRLARRDISSDTVTRLFTAGPLTIRVFQHALDQAGFEQAFGRTEIETLARGLANIGGFGKKNERAKAGFRSSRGTEIFEFLVRNGLLETRHHKGQAVYLKRI